MKNYKNYLAIGACALLLTGTAVNADTILKEISAFTNQGVKIVVDDEEFVAKDEQGNKLDPITYNDRTYLPLRAIGEALGKDVNWDNDTQTVVIGEKVEGDVERGTIVSKDNNHIKIDKKDGLDPTTVNITRDTVFEKCTLDSLKINDEVVIHTTGVSIMIYPRQVTAIKVIKE